MRNRWFHAPRLHSPGPGEEKRVGWIELFYDLVYVAAIIQLGNGLSYHPDLYGFLGFAALFAAIWYAWTSFTFYSNRFDVDDLLHRVLVFVKMFGIASMAVLAPGVFEGRTQGFALAYTLVRVTVIAFYVRAYLHADRGRALSGRYAIGFSIGALFWLASAFAPKPWVWVLWVAGFAIELSAPITGKARELNYQHPPDAAHLSERFGLLTIIVLGESFVKVLTDLAAASEVAGWETAAMGGVALLVTCSVWWIYFDDVVHSRIRQRPAARLLWLYAHLPLAIGVTSLGVGIKKAVAANPDVALETARWILGGSLGLVFLAVAVLDWVTERDESTLDDAARVWMRLGSAAAILALTAAGDLIPNWLFLTLIATVSVAQVVADLMIAPLAAQEVDHSHLQSAFDRPLELTPEEIEANAQRQRRDPLEAVRVGTPSGLRRGLYFFFMHGSWMRLLFAAIASFLIINLIFAVLYLFDPGAVSGATPDSLRDAFAFSVQTISTIGYGTLSPGSAYGDLLVVVEAIIGVLFTAFFTGLVFAKASRPEASVLFSEPIVVTQFEGTPALMFRLANARGNEIVQATIQVSTALEEETTEGHRMRRIRDLELVRDNQPLFSLTWTVVHRIDEKSPFYGLDEAAVRECNAGIIASMTGYDATYAQTVHARNIWYADDMRWGERLVDVLSELDDGRMSIDYRRFHHTESQPAG